MHTDFCIPMCTTVCSRGLIDSGTSCLVLPGRDAQRFYDAVREAGVQSFCGIVFRLPLHFSGKVMGPGAGPL